MKKRLRFWKKKADHVTNDHWVRFIFYWMIFDAYLTENSEKDSDTERLNWFYTTDNELKGIFKEYWGKPDYQTALEELKKLSPVQDMRPSQRGYRAISLENAADVNQIIAFIYQIRCNTFHGTKDLSSSRDQHLVRLSQDILNQPLNSFLGLDDSNKTSD